MSTIALYAVGAVVGGALTGGAAAPVFLGLSGAALGGAIGGFVGSYIDQQFLFPAIFGGQSASRAPRLTDIGVQTAAEGTPMQYVLGPYNRVAGQLIWMDKLRHHNHHVSGDGNDFDVYYVNVAVAVCEGPILAITRIWADSKLIYDNGILDKRTRGLTVYLGTEAQTADPLIESFLGSGNVPGYRGTAYVVFDRLHLTDFGNRVPSLTFEVQRDASLTVADAIGRVLERQGLTSDQYDTSLVPDYLMGYAVAGPQSAVTVLEPLLAAYSLGVQESNGVLRFKAVGYETRIAVIAEDLAAHESGSGGSGGTQPTRPILLMDQTDQAIPSQVEVKYLDVSHDYQQGSQREKLINAPFTGVSQIDLPISATPAFARALAATRLTRAYVERVTAQVDLPPSYIHVEELDVLLVPYGTETYAVRVDQIDRGNNWLIQVKGTIVNSYTSAARPGECGNQGTTTVYDPDAVAVLAYFLDVPALAETEAVRPGLYLVAATLGNWEGGDLYSGPDGATGWTDLAVVQTNGVAGRCLTTLGDGPTGFWDVQNTVDVILSSGTLETADSDLNVLNGDNRIYIGDELIAFVTATVTGTNTYRLSRLLRGLACTEDKTATHAASELALAWSVDSVQFVSMGTGDIGNTKYFEIVPAGGTIGDFANTVLTPNANTLRQYSPIGLTGARDGSSNLTIAWTRRTRSPNFPILTSTLTPPLLAGAEAYSIDILNAPGGTVLRTLTSSTPTVAYSAADQTTDFGSPQSSVAVVVYQLDDQGRRGYPGVATV